MTDFFDWLTVGDSGLGTDRLSDGFNLSHAEIRKTAEALAPAYSLALQRAMVDPSEWTRLSRAFMPFMSDGFMPGPEVGRFAPAASLTDTLFGSPDVSATVARKVSLATGIAPDTVEALMRNFSVMTMQAMVAMMLANMTRSRGPDGTGETYHASMAEMMRRGANAVEAMGRPSDASPPSGRGEKRPDSAALAELFSNALTGRLPFLPPSEDRKGVRKQPDPSHHVRSSARAPDDSNAGRPQDAATPFAPFDEMMQGFSRGLTSQGETGNTDRGAEPQRADGPTHSQAGGSFDDLARAGRDMQEEYARQMLDFFKLPGTQPEAEK